MGAASLVWFYLLVIGWCLACLGLCFVFVDLLGFVVVYCFELNWIIYGLLFSVCVFDNRYFVGLYGGRALGLLVFRVSLRFVFCWFDVWSELRVVVVVV